MPQFNFDERLAFFNIMVPTVETVRYSYLCDRFVKSGSNTLIIGNSGAGKTNVISQFLSEMDIDKFIFKQLNFSA